MNSEFGHLVKRLRAQAGLSQAYLARQLGRERSWIAHIERGDCLPSAAQIEALATCLGVEADLLLLTAQTRPGGNETEQRMSRQVVRQFSAAWRGGHREMGGRQQAAGGAQRVRLLTFLNRQVGDASLRAKLKSLGLGCLEVAQLALELLNKGAQWARLSWAQVGFPVALLDSDNCCLNHLPRTCLVWADKERALALFGESTAANPRYYPPVLACIERSQRQYLALEGVSRQRRVGANSGSAGQNGAESLPAVPTDFVSWGRCRLVQRLALGGMPREDMQKWLGELLSISPASP